MWVFSVYKGREPYFEYNQLYYIYSIILAIRSKGARFSTYFLGLREGVQVEACKAWPTNTAYPTNMLSEHRNTRSFSEQHKI